jgi:hypothetical protein
MSAGPLPSSRGPIGVEEYNDAWLRLVKSGAVDPQTGIDLLSFPIGQYISRQLAKGEDSALMGNYPGTVGVALSLRYRNGEIQPNEPCITLFVSEEAATSRIPSEFQEIPTNVVVAGTPVLNAGGPHTPGTPVNPVEPGCSVSHSRVSCGTFGCLVRDDDNKQYVLSCAHVLSDSVPGQRGDAILHPGTQFGGALQIAEFTRAIPLQPGNCIADAAVAEVLDSATVTSAIRYIGTKPSGTRVLNGVGLVVQKSGDETGRTTGVVTGISSRVGPYSANGVNNIFFNNAIVATGMSAGGDSGSILLSLQAEAVGVIFGGLQYLTASGTVGYVCTWCSPIDVVLKHLGVSLA